MQATPPPTPCPPRSRPWLFLSPHPTVSSASRVQREARKEKKVGRRSSEGQFMSLTQCVQIIKSNTYIFVLPIVKFYFFSFIILLCIHLKARHCLHTKPMIACFLIELRDSYSTNINIIISRVLLKIKEAFCTSVRCVSDHGSRRLQHNSHPGCDRSSH